MKYIMFVKPQKHLTLFIPIIFPNLLVHSDMRDILCKDSSFADCSVRSAGFLAMDGQAHGESESLGVKSHPDDTDIIAMNDYGAGWV